MNVTTVGSREVLFIGTGKIPIAEVQQVVKEFVPLSQRLIFSYLPLRDEPKEPWPVPTAPLEAIERLSVATALIMYGGAMNGLAGWDGYEWDDSLLTDDGIEEDDIVICWLISDEPDGSEIDFVQKALDAGRQVLVANEGLWQVDRLTEQGIHERVESEPYPSVPLHPAQQAHVDELAEVEPNLAHLVPDDPEMTPEQEISTEPLPQPPPFTGTIEQSTDLADAYYDLSKDELKRLVVERDLKADKRSIDSMVDALVDNDLEQSGEPGTVLQFKQKADDDHPANGDALVGDEGTPFEEARVELADAVDELTDAEQAQLDAGVTSEPGRDLTSEQLAKVAENLGKVDAGAEKLQRMAQDMISSTQGPVPASTVAHEPPNNDKVLILDGLATITETLQHIALLNTQLADAMLALKQELEG